MANLLQMTNADNIWSAVKKIKVKTPIEYDCDTMEDWFESGKKALLVAAVESELGISSTDTIFKNISAVHVETAAKMFIYLNTCASTDSLKDWFKLWSGFYNNLFQTQSLNHILLTLNRMMKDETRGNSDAKLRAQKLFKRMKTLFTLEYEYITNTSEKAQGKVFLLEIIPHPNLQFICHC